MLEYRPHAMSGAGAGAQTLQIVDGLRALELLLAAWGAEGLLPAGVDAAGS